jgi:hypothetical protein
MVEARMKFDPGMFVDALVPDRFGRRYLYLRIEPVSLNGQSNPAPWKMKC